MLAGHYATALIARQKSPKAPIWLLLIAAFSLDAIWLGFAFLGLEVPSPNNWLHATFLNIRVNMDYSHDLVPVMGWAMAMLVIAWSITRSLSVAYWCTGLLLFHFLCDMVVGFKHHMMGLNSPSIGLGLYNIHPSLAIIIEAGLCAACVTWFIRARKRAGQPVHTTHVIYLHLLFVGGALLWLFTADTSISQWLSLL